MHLGLCMFATDYAIRIGELARAAEERGSESLWASDRTVLDRYAAAGITRSLFILPSEGRDSILPRLDELAKLLPR